MPLRGNAAKVLVAVTTNNKGHGREERREYVIIAVLSKIRDRRLLARFAFAGDGLLRTDARWQDRDRNALLHQQLHRLGAADRRRNSRTLGN